MKIVKYGNGMRAQKWYTSECPHCHTVWKNNEFEVVYVDEDQKTLVRPSPSYKATCPLCGKEELYYLKGKQNQLQKVLKYNTEGTIKTMMLITLLCCLALFGIVWIPNVVVRAFISAIPLAIIVAFALIIHSDCE